MKVDIEQPQAWSRRLRITIPADQVERERRDVATKLAKRVRLPGFRKGKVPASVLEKQYGASIEQQTIEQVVNSAYREAIQREGFAPVSQAAVENLHYHPGQDLSFDVQFEVQPQVELGRLGGFMLQRPAVSVGDEDVDRVLERLRHEQATWSPVEERPQTGDRAHVQITPLPAGGEEPAAAQSYEVVLGTGEILEEIDRAIRTLEPGAEGEFDVALPPQADQPAPEPHRIRLRLERAERPELPALDDEFARKLGDFDAADALRARVREDLAAEAEREADREVRRQLVQNLLEANPFDVPPALVDQYVDSVIQAPEGADADEVARAKETTRPAAEYAVRRMLVLERVAELENLRATEADVEARVAEIAARNQLEPAEVRRQLARSDRLQALASEITERRVFEYLTSLSTVTTQSE